MSLTLAANISASQRIITITGTVTQSPGYQFRLGDELLELQGFARGNHGARNPLDKNRWYVTRGLGVSTPASHTAGTEVLGAVDAFAAATSGTTPPDPFASPGGGQTADVQAALDGANDPDAGNVFATMADVGGGGNPQPTLTDLGLADPPAWQAETNFLIPFVTYDAYGPAVYQLDGWVLAAEDQKGSGNLTGTEAPDLTGLGVGDAVSDGDYTSYIISSVASWPPTPATWAAGEAYNGLGFVWPTEPDGSLWGPDPGYPQGTPVSVTEPDFGAPSVVYNYVADPDDGYWLKWGRGAYGAFGGAMPAIRGRSLDITAYNVGDANAYFQAVSETGRAIATPYATSTTSTADATSIAETISGTAIVGILALFDGAEFGIDMRRDENGCTWKIRGSANLPTADPGVRGVVWLDNGHLAVSAGP